MLKRPCALAQMATMPRWLSSNRVDLLRKLLEHDPAMLMRETMGVSVRCGMLVKPLPAVRA